MARRATLLGTILWTLQPLYIVAEVLIGRQASADYTFTGGTVSDLGNTACRYVRGDVMCSPWHTAMNAAFFWSGCTMIIGALLFGSRYLPGRVGAASVALWCVSGLGSIGVSLFPVNEDPVAHGIVALPIFLAQPAALLLMGLSLSGTRPRLAAGTLVVTAVSLVGAIGFGILAGTDSDWTGAFERLALWPGYLWVSVVAVCSATGLSPGGQYAPIRYRRSGRARTSE